MKFFYVVSYILKSDIENGKYTADKIQYFETEASDATRAISSAKGQLVDSGKIESPGDIKVLETKWATIAK